MKMLAVVKNQFSKDKLSLRHESPAVFVTSQWQKNADGHGDGDGDGNSEDGRRCLWYLIYRWFVTLYFVTTWILSIVIKEPNEDARAKWLIYLTNWGYTMCMLQALLCTFMLTYGFLDSSNKNKKGECANRACLKLYQIYWATNIIATDIAFGITVLYWAVIYDASKIELDAMNVIVHGTNALLMLVELFVSGHPFRWVHFYLPICFGLVYVIFSAIYYAAGGTAKNGKTAIYPILDWNKPGPTVLVCLGVMLFLVLLHLISYGIYKLRKRIKRRYVVEINIDENSGKEETHVNQAFESDASRIV